MLLIFLEQNSCLSKATKINPPVIFVNLNYTSLKILAVAFAMYPQSGSLRLNAFRSIHFTA